MRVSCASTSPASIRPIPHPPTAAPAAGGWEIDGSRRVHSVGSTRVAAGGAEETAASSECFLWATTFSAARVAPVERHGGPVAPCAAAARLSCGARCPRAGGRVMAVPAFEDLEGAVAGVQAGVAVRRAGWRCSRTEERRLPCRQGGPPSPCVWRIGGGFRRRSGLLGGDDARAQKDFFVIFFYFWAFL